MAIAVAYDTQLAPIDVRLLTLSMRAVDHQGVYFETSRRLGAKLATISKCTELPLERYLAGLPFVVSPDQPFIRTRTPWAMISGTCRRSSFPATRGASWTCAGQATWKLSRAARSLRTSQPS